jgi:hypothetical protein
MSRHRKSWESLRLSDGQPGAFNKALRFRPRKDEDRRGEVPTSNKLAPRLIEQQIQPNVLCLISGVILAIAALPGSLDQVTTRSGLLQAVLWIDHKLLMFLVVV